VTFARRAVVSVAIAGVRVDFRVAPRGSRGRGRHPTARGAASGARAGISGRTAQATGGRAGSSEAGGGEALQQTRDGSFLSQPTERPAKPSRAMTVVSVVAILFVTSPYPPPHYSASRWGRPSSARPRARSPPSPARPRFRETRSRPRHPRGRRRGTPRSRARDAAASRCGDGAGDGTQWAPAARRTPGEARTPGWSFASCARCGCVEVVTPARCNGRLPGSIRRGSRAAKGRAGDPEGDFDRGVHFRPLRRTARPRAASPLGRPRASCV
jgi:hypothetical protein